MYTHAFPDSRIKSHIKEFINVISSYLPVAIRVQTAAPLPERPPLLRYQGIYRKNGVASDLLFLLLHPWPFTPSLLSSTAHPRVPYPTHSILVCRSSYHFLVSAPLVLFISIYWTTVISSQDRQAATLWRPVSKHEARLKALLSSGKGRDTLGNFGETRISAQQFAGLPTVCYRNTD